MVSNVGDHIVCGGHRNCSNFVYEFAFFFLSLIVFAFEKDIIGWKKSCPPLHRMSKISLHLSKDSSGCYNSFQRHDVTIWIFVFQPVFFFFWTHSIHIRKPVSYKLCTISGAIIIFNELIISLQIRHIFRTRKQCMIWVSYQFVQGYQTDDDSISFKMKKNPWNFQDSRSKWNEIKSMENYLCHVLIFNIHWRFR